MRSDPEQILVCGGAGYIGPHMCKALARRLGRLGQNAAMTDELERLAAQACSERQP